MSLMRCLLTSDTKTKPVETAQELEAGLYIMKPYTLEKIGVAVKDELKKYAVFEPKAD